MVSLTRGPAQVIVPAALVVVAAVALRGWLPGGGQSEDPPRTLSETAALAMVVALAAVLFILVAVARYRNEPASEPAERPEWLRDRLRARTVVIVAVAAAVALVGCLLLVRLLPAGQPAEVAPPPGPPDTAGPAVPGTPPPAGRRPTPADGATSAVLTGVGVVSLLLVAAGLFLVRRDRRRMAPPAPPDEAGSPAPGVASASLARAAELGLAEVGDLSRDPRAAIIACYATMERELARVPGMAPRDFDTASEVLARAVDHRVLRSDSATPLVDLFEEARFSPHVMDEGHRDAARRTLRLVLAELGAPS